MTKEAIDAGALKSVLVLRLGAIGDALRVLPAVRRLRTFRPDLEIGWAVEDWVYPVVAGNPNLDRFHVLRRGELGVGLARAQREIARYRRELRGAGYDAVLDFHGRLKSGIVSRFSAAPWRIGYSRRDASEGNHLFNNIHVTLPDSAENRVLRFLHLLGPLGIPTGWDPDDTGLYIDPVVRGVARAWHQSVGRPALAVYPGSSAVRVRERWPEAKWIDLLGRLGRCGIRSAVLWGPAEQEVAARIAAAAGSSCALAPATTLPEMLAMVGCFSGFIGSDTAAMHMAWLQGIPTAVFVGPKSPRTVAPLDPAIFRVLRAEKFYVEGRRARRQDDAIVSAVPVEDAVEAVQYLLAASRAQSVARSESRLS